MSQTNHHIRACDELIERTLAEEEIRLATLRGVVDNGEYQEQLDNLHFLEAETKARVEAQEMTQGEAEEAIEAYCNWIEYGQSYTSE